MSTPRPPAQEALSMQQQQAVAARTITFSLIDDLTSSVKTKVKQGRMDTAFRTK